MLTLKREKLYVLYFMYVHMYICTLERCQGTQQGFYQILLLTNNLHSWRGEESMLI